MENKKVENWMRYAAAIQSKIAELFDEEEGELNYSEVFTSEKNIKDFLHALGNVAPTQFYNKVQDDNKNFLEGNHMFNTLLFEYMNTDD